MPRVSVVIPVYKVEKYLPACLDSVLSQSLQDIEVICIDDASPDRCPEMLDEYAGKDARVRVLHLPENHQQGYGRNRGTEMAKGKYVYFLDSDDMITPEAMEEAESEEPMDNSWQIDSAEPVAKDSARPKPTYEAEEGAAMAEADYVLSIKIRRAGASDESVDMYESIDVGEVVYSGISELVVKKITDNEIVFTSDGGLIEPNENGSINLNATPPKTFTVKAGEEKVLVTQTTDGSDKITISYNGM